MANSDPLACKLNVDAKGNIRGRCESANCNCFEYKRTPGSNACGICVHAAAKHVVVEDNRKCLELSAFGEPCDCTGWDPTPPPVDNECFICMHKKEKHALLPPTIRVMKSGDAGWKHFEDEAKKIRKQDHAAATIKKSNWGGRRPGAGFKGLLEPAASRIIKFTPAKLRPSGCTGSGISLSEELNLPLTVAALESTARRLFAEKYDVELSEQNEVFCIATDGTRLNEKELARAEGKFGKKVTRVYYYNPYFEKLPRGKEAITREYGLAEQESSDEEDFDSVKGNTRKARKVDNDDNASRSVKHEMDATLPYGIPLAAGGHIATREERLGSALSSLCGALCGHNNSRQKSSSRTSLVSTSSGDSGFSTRRSSTPTTGVSTVTSGLWGSMTLDHAVDQDNQNEDQRGNNDSDNAVEFYADMYHIAPALMKLALKLHHDNLEDASQWIERCMQDGQFTHAKALSELFRFFLRGSEIQLRSRVVILNRMQTNDQMEIYLTAMFKDATPETLKKKVLIGFENEQGAGRALVDAYILLLQKHMLTKYFEGDVDHRIPRKSVAEELMRLIGSIMGHIICQEKPVLVGMSPVFKNYAAGVRPCNIQVTTKDLPCSDLQEAIDKILQDGDLRNFDAENKKILSNAIDESGLLEDVRMVTEPGNVYKLPYAGFERQVAHALMQTIVLGERRGQYEALAHGMNDVCSIMDFIRNGEGFDGPNPLMPLIDQYFPSARDTMVRREEIFACFDFEACGNDELDGHIRDAFRTFIDGLAEADPCKAYSIGGSDGGELSVADFWQYLTGYSFRFNEDRVTVRFKDNVRPFIPHVCTRTFDVHPDMMRSNETVDGFLSELKRNVTFDRDGFGALYSVLRGK